MGDSKDLEMYKNCLVNSEDIAWAQAVELQIPHIYLLCYLPVPSKID